MSRAPDVRRINMLSEYRDPDIDAAGTQGFWRSLSEADNFIREHDRAAELECRCDELTQLVEEIKALHQEHGWYQSQRNWCGTCQVKYPCPTIQLIEGNT